MNIPQAGDGESRGLAARKPGPAASRSVGTIAGLVALVAALAVASLTAAILKVDGPVAAVGNRFIDATPKWLKDFAISAFGTADKAVLIGGILVVLGLAAAAVGRLASRRFVFAVVGTAVLALIGVLAATTRSGSQGADWIPPVAGSIAALLAFWLLLRRPVGTTGAVESPAAFDRRRFLTGAVVLGVASGGMALSSTAVRRSRIKKITAAVKQRGLPAPTSLATTEVAAASIGNGVAPFVPPTAEFYRIDTALVIPTVDVSTWKLTVNGMVDNPLTLTYDDLLAMPMIERYVTLSCVSNEVGGNLLGNAKWLGVPLAEVLKKAGVQPGASQLASKSVEGWTCGFPTELAVDGRDAMIAVGMNDEVLPRLHGFPARLVIPGIYGYVSATKWLNEITLTTMDAFDGYWIPRGWSKLGPIKTQSRIDVPRRGTGVTAGKVPIAGVAWAMHRGISKVEVRVDDGEWAEARLADEPTVDAWRQWVYEWDATPGRHLLSVRATDGDGVTQTGDIAPVDPDGATGWHTIRVTVT